MTFAAKRNIPYEATSMVPRSTFETLASGTPPYINERLNLGSVGDVPLSDRITVFAPVNEALFNYRFNTEEERELVRACVCVCAFLRECVCQAVSLV